MEEKAIKSQTILKIALFNHKSQESDRNQS